ncbi:DNA replication licensing factor Mcm3 [Strongyloides ratti]|uniref:DNA replication licensing factor MCM3 n=1 Tax=Strongyloides ratti TaxID=34506 RepID=A0A090LI71_STRRB|nr:DNA replication licensing factor Mcm3 [Strongyloides ratti]CEF69516.1 DNA replication licensing factor Mcm3 [Strongyloides ratti]
MNKDSGNNYTVDVNIEQKKREIKQEYVNFLDDSNEKGIYFEKVNRLITENEVRLIVNINDLRSTFPERCNELLSKFVDEIVPFEQALKEVVMRHQPNYGRETNLHIGFEGAFGTRHVNPRSLKSSFLGSLVCCEGIVIRASQVRPKVVKSVHYCPATGKTLEKKYSDLTSYEALLTSNAYPKEDENKNPLETEFGLSTYKDSQTFTIQELPECAPTGQLPRNVDIIADDDLADRCKPGDRIRVIGLYRCLPNKNNGVSTGNFRGVVIANNIQLLSKEIDDVELSPKDLEDIKRIAKRPDVFELLARSLAPSIYGHNEVKKAVLCLLLGGNEKILQNGSRLRGDINVLLIGDPSVAKSQVLRYILHTAPRAIATTGRGSSGVGLTAAVVNDSDTGERRLEAGAMVLADRGIVCIDEFDKMADMDKTAIHEVMEQGKVTISKAGIHAKLNARCSVLAAANPIYGRYNPFKSPMVNIGMQDSLLSRFDFIFVLLDEHEMDRDRNIASHVLKLHMYRAPGEAEGQVLPFGNDLQTFTTITSKKKNKKNSTVYEKNQEWAAVTRHEKILSMEFMRKYIHIAKKSKPGLTEEACEFINEAYTELRSYDTETSDSERTMPITARQLETLIRASTAIAKARNHALVTQQDAEEAYDLLKFACLKEKTKERLDKRKKKKTNNVEYDSDEDIDDGEPEVVNPSQSSTRQRKRPAAGTPEMENIIEEETENATLKPSAKRTRRNTPSISVDRYRAFKKYLRQAIDAINRPDELVPQADIVSKINEFAGILKFTDEELAAAFERAESDNIIMISENNIVLI